MKMLFRFCLVERIKQSSFRFDQKILATVNNIVGIGGPGLSAGKRQNRKNVNAPISAHFGVKSDVLT